MESLYQDEIRNLKDQDLQLQYILGGLYPHGGLECFRYWACDIRCATKPVKKDEKFIKVKSFMTKHHMSNSSFLSLASSYLSGSFNSFRGDWGNLIPELDRAIMDYNFVHSSSLAFKENDLKEKELLELIKNNDPLLQEFLTKYLLTEIDFLILAKTRLNYRFKFCRGFKDTDLIQDLKTILKQNDLYQSYEWVQAYRKSLEQQEKEKIEQPKTLKRVKNIFAKHFKDC